MIFDFKRAILLVSLFCIGGINGQYTYAQPKSSKLEHFHESIILTPQKTNVSPVQTQNQRYVFLSDTRESLASPDDVSLMHNQPKKPVLSAYQRNVRYRYPSYGQQNTGVGPIYPFPGGGGGAFGGGYGGKQFFMT